LQLLVEKTYIIKNTCTNKPHLTAYLILPDIITVLALVLQMGNVLQDKLQDHWSRLEQFYIPFYGKTITQILVYTAIFLHFEDNCKRPDWKKNKTM
jgi:hypothetical protein